MAGIYIHIPFCKTRCIYCDFFTQTNLRYKRRFVDALCNELIIRKNYLNSEAVDTVYFGGGTPSQLEKDDFVKLFNAINENYAVQANAEISIEANPDDLDAGYINMLRSFPFNRISMGVQSLNDCDLEFLRRRHSAQKAVDAVKACQEAGFSNISIDLMYGLPGQTPESWKSSLDKAIALNVKHISAYHLIYEEETELYRLLQKGAIKQVDESLSVEMFAVLKEKLEQAGFIHYEISNFATEGFFSRHNSSYWSGEKYMGIGPAAHSYNGEARAWNIAAINEYMEAIESGSMPAETEVLSDTMRYNDFILTGMRTIWGISLDRLEKLFGTKMRDYCLQNASKYIETGYIINNDNRLTISTKGLLVSDGIMSDLMSV
ncbi:radical SAM family heme chaperone HemW [Viscerimonas tarda]